MKNQTTTNRSAAQVKLMNGLLIAAGIAWVTLLIGMSIYFGTGKD